MTNNLDSSIPAPHLTVLSSISCCITLPYILDISSSIIRADLRESSGFARRNISRQKNQVRLMKVTNLCLSATSSRSGLRALLFGDNWNRLRSVMQQFYSRLMVWPRAAHASKSTYRPMRQHRCWFRDATDSEILNLDHAQYDFVSNSSSPS